MVGYWVVFVCDDDRIDLRDKFDLYILSLIVMKARSYEIMLHWQATVDSPLNAAIKEFGSLITHSEDVNME